MLALCMGTMKQSLLNIKAEKSRKIGNFLAFINIADNEPLITNLESEYEYSTAEMVGYVTGLNFGPGGYKCATFGICTNETVDVAMCGPFGRVTEGLDVVQAAFEHNPITEVTITDSGLVLPGLAL